MAVLNLTPAASSAATATIGIVNRSLTESYPEAVTFDLTLANFDTPEPSTTTYDRQFHELHCEWSFDDIGNFTAPTNYINRDANKSYGTKVSHTFLAAGTYTVTCVVTEPSSGKTATGTLDVTVGDADTTYTGTRTIWVHPTSDTTDRPAGMSGSAVATTIDAAMTTVFTGTAGVPRRIVLARGTSHTPSSLQTMGTTSNRMDVLITSAGVGARPILDLSSAQFTWGSATGATVEADLKIQGLDMRGPWDVTLDEDDGAQGARLTAVRVFENRPQQLLIDDCVFGGFDITIYTTNTGTAITGDEVQYLNNNTFTSWRGACFFHLGKQNIALTGNSMVQDPDALNGYLSSPPHNDVSAAVRIPSADFCLFNQNEVFQKCGWVISGDYFTNQGCFRGNTTPVLGAHYHLWGNSMEGGFSVVGFNNADGPASLAMNAVIEMNYMLGDHQSNRAIQFSFGGGTIRNNVCVTPNTTRLSGYGFGEFIQGTRAGTDAENAAAPVNIYNNTFVNEITTAVIAGGAFPMVGLDAGMTNVNVDNNINHQPNRGLVVPNMSSSVLWTARMTQYVDDDTAAITSVATGDAKFWQLTTASAADNTDPLLVAYDDYAGAVRSATTDVGALEV